MISFILLSCVIGLFIGSFLNVIIDRVPRGESFLWGRSHCDFCKHQLHWYDEIPLFSYAFLRGRCRYCQKKIGWKYPLVELTTGFLFATTVAIFLPSSLLTVCFALCIISSSIVIFYTDIWSGIIPDGAIIIQTSITLIVFLIQKEILLPHLFGLLLGLALFVALWLLTKRKGMGFGDVKLVGSIGFLLGIPFLFPALYIAFLTGAGVALILITTRKKRFKKDTIPFGPFLVLGELLTFFWGNQLWHIILVNIFHL